MSREENQREAVEPLLYEVIVSILEDLEVISMELIDEILKPLRREERVGSSRAAAVHVPPLTPSTSGCEQTRACHGNRRRLWLRRTSLSNNGCSAWRLCC